MPLSSTSSLLLALALVAAPPADPPQGFTALFDGRTLDGWRGFVAAPHEEAALDARALVAAREAADARMREHWSVVAGELRFDGGGESLVTERDDWGDYELFVSWMIEPGGDSGLYLRGVPQIQIWDRPEIGSGGLYNDEIEPSNPLVVADLPPGSWNRFHVILRGDRVTVRLNDRLVVDRRRLENFWNRAVPLPDVGRIELQAHGAPIRFRDLWIREIPREDPDDPATTARRARDARMAWWREARFGIFVHWGLYAIPAGRWNGAIIPGASEWLMHSAKIPPREYDPLARQFDPTDFDAEEWASIVRDAGAGYLVITSKHHDGFCLWDAEGFDHDAVAAPFGRDVLAELAPALRAEGLRVGWYHSILDWRHPDYLPRRPWDDRPDDDADFERYVRHLHRQLGELLTRYGPIDVLWFDGEWESTWTHEHGVATDDLVRGLAPAIIVNNRVDKGRQGMAGLDRAGEWRGDFGTPEQEVPPSGIPGADWETCMTMNHSWGWKVDDTDWKSATTLIRTLVDVASKGGNFLLNVGPDARGRFPEACVERLREIGAWMRDHAESIRGTTASPFGRLPFGRCTMRVDAGAETTRLYLHLFDPPADGMLRLPGLESPPVGAFLLGDPDRRGLPVRRDAAGLRIELPRLVSRGAGHAVVVLDVAGTPARREILPAPDASGTLLLPAIDAALHGPALRYESGAERDCLGYWTSAEAWASWRVRIPAAGRYRVVVVHAVAPGHGGSLLRAEAGVAAVELLMEETGGWGEFVSGDAGVLAFEAGGPVTIALRVAALRSPAAANVRAVRLERVE